MSNETEDHLLPDMIHRLMTISKLSYLITNHRWFQRLKKIKQLGSLNFIHKQAVHSRYEHSIGVAYLARVIGKSLQEKYHEITNKELLCLELAGLCHDLGHGAYSHSFDHLLHDLKIKCPTREHEVRSQVIFRHLIEDLRLTNAIDFNDDDIKLTQYFIDPKKYIEYLSSYEDLPNDGESLGNKLNIAETKEEDDNFSYRWGKYQISNKRKRSEIDNSTDNSSNSTDNSSDLNNNNAIKESVNKIQKYDLIPFYAGLEQIVNNYIHKVDVDKMDYLLRDATILRFDIVLKNELDIISMLQRVNIVDGNLCYHIDDQGIIHDLITRRFLFYTNCYLHPEVNAISCMLSDALKMLNKVNNFSNCSLLKTKNDVEEFCKLTDEYMIDILLNTKDLRLNSAKKLMYNVIKGKDLYKFIGDFEIGNSKLDNSKYIELPRNVFTDKSNPANSLPKVLYHKNGEPEPNPTNANYRRMYTKNDD